MTRQQSRWPKLIISAIISVQIAIPAHSVWAWRCDPIIFDPQNFGQHVQQVTSWAQQLMQAATQIQNQLKELAPVAVGSAPSIDLTAVTSSFVATAYVAANAQQTITSQFPMRTEQLAAQDTVSLRTQWNQQQRAALMENRQIQNQLYEQMPVTQSQVETIVDASNNAPGETAALQAHNNLIAVLSQELSSYQALKASRARLRAEAIARQQSERAYHQAQADAVMKDFQNPAKSTIAVRGYFQSE